MNADFMGSRNSSITTTLTRHRRPHSSLQLTKQPQSTAWSAALYAVRRSLLRGRVLSRAKTLPSLDALPDTLASGDTNRGGRSYLDLYMRGVASLGFARLLPFPPWNMSPARLALSTENGRVDGQHPLTFDSNPLGVIDAVTRFTREVQFNPIWVQQAPEGTSTRVTW